MFLSVPEGFYNERLFKLRKSNSEEIAPECNDPYVVIRFAEVNVIFMKCSLLDLQYFPEVNVGILQVISRDMY